MYLPNAPQQMRSAPKLAMVNARIIFKQDNNKKKMVALVYGTAQGAETGHIIIIVVVVVVGRKNARSGMVRCGTLRRPTTESRSVKPLVKITYNFPRLVVHALMAAHGAWICSLPTLRWKNCCETKARGN